MKTCSKCGQIKPETEFYKSKTLNDGLSPWCKECHKKSAREWHKVHPEKSKTNKTEYRKNHREQERERSGKWYKNNPDKARNGHLKRRYGIDQPTYLTLLASQGGKCAICGTAESGGHGVWHIDHDHETGKIRGLLCHGCNTALGGFGDNPDRLLAAVDYLYKDVAMNQSGTVKVVDMTT